MAVYSLCEKYQKLYYSSKEPGRHYYAGDKALNPGKYGDDTFTDWEKLPTIIPQSIIEKEKTKNIPLDLEKQLDVARELFERAKECRLIDDDGVFYELNDTTMNELREAVQACETDADSTNSIAACKELLKRIREAKRPLDIRPIATGIQLPEDGRRSNADMIRSLQKDHFVSSPALQRMVADAIVDMDERDRYAEKLEQLESDIEKELARL